MKKAIALFLALTMTAGLLAGCGGEANTTNQTEAPGETQTAAPTETPAAETESAGDKVADASDMVTPEEVVEEGMEPVYAWQLVDGTYEVTVDSSSSMFNITSCQLTVEGEEMTAVMTMSGTGYLYLYMGTGEEAAAAGESAYIPYEELDSGEHTFTVPVAGLDMAIDCAAFSKKKEMWYDRQLLFRADSLPQEAFAQGEINTVESLGLEDGSYTVEVSLEGGSGKASVESPAQLVVEDGQATATIVWSSSNYDYMKVDEEQYLPVSTEGNSTFEIPVTGFDWKMPVLADTTAMSTPHEIEYTLYFDSSTIQSAQ